MVAPNECPSTTTSGLELRAVRDGEGQVIQAVARLVERVLAAAPVLREPEASLQAVIPEKHLTAGPAGRLELAHAPEAEHFLIPGRARVNVTDGQSKVVNPCDHAVFTTSMPRAASRTGLALHQAPGPRGPFYRSIISFRCRTGPQARHRRTLSDVRQNRMIRLVALPSIAARHPPAGHSVRMRETPSQGSAP